jgi:hypothetical protein
MSLIGKTARKRMPRDLDVNSGPGEILPTSPYALISSLSRATRSCGSLALLMRYSLAVAWKLPGHFKKPTWHKPTNCRVDDNDTPTLNLCDGNGPRAFLGGYRWPTTLIQLT